MRYRNLPITPGHHQPPGSFFIYSWNTLKPTFWPSLSIALSCASIWQRIHCQKLRKWRHPVAKKFSGVTFGEIRICLTTSKRNYLLNFSLKKIFFSALTSLSMMDCSLGTRLKATYHQQTNHAYHSQIKLIDLN